MKVKISKFQYFFLLPNLIYGKAIGITAGIVVRQVGGDAWSAMIIGFLIGLLFVMLASIIAVRFKEKNIVQISKELIGPRTSLYIGLLLSMYFAGAFTISCNVLNMHLKEYLLPQTPFFVLCVVYILLCAYGAALGFEVIIRFSFFGFIMTMLINITMMLGTVRDFRLQNMRPLLDTGIMKNLQASPYVFVDISMIILSIFIIYPMISDKKNIGKITFWGTFLGIVTVIIWPIFETAVLGADVMKQFVVVCMQQVRSAQITIYLPRYELIMVSFFVWGLFVQSVTMLYCCIYCIKQITGVKKHGFIIVPLTLILIIFTYYEGRDHNFYVHFIKFIWTPVSLVLSIGIPLVLLLAMLLKQRKIKKSE